MSGIDNILTTTALRFPVTVQAQNGVEDIIPVILRKDQLQAAQIVGQSSKELIQRLCKRSGYTVLDIGKPERKTLEFNLSEMWWL